MSFYLLPAVDVAGGKAVRLVQGAAGTETDSFPMIFTCAFWRLRRLVMIAT